MHIRSCTVADLHAVTEIYADAVRHGLATFELEPPDATEIGRRHAAGVAAGFPWLVAEAEGIVLGYAYANAYRPRPAYRATVEDSVYIHTAHQGRGIGRRLLTELVAQCAALGFRQMVAVIGDTANAASLRLHESAGFAYAGTLRAVGYKHGQWVDTVLMQRSLGDGVRTPPSPLEG
jgi:L-amino acid N-acyltransferase YncA